MPRMWIVPSIVLFVFISVLTFFWFAQRSLMYLPSGDVATPDEAGVPSADVVRIRTDDGLQLGGWFVGASPGASRGAVIVFNGNAGNRTYRGTLAARLVEAGFSVLLFDYRGYGDSEGAPSETGLLSDARAALAYVRSRADVESSRVAYFGESLGSGVAVALAAEQPPAALVLRSPFTSAVDVGRHHYPWLPVGWLLVDQFDSIGRMARLSCPTLFIAGDRDRVVPFGQTRSLFDAAREPKEILVLRNADHNDESLAEGPEMIARTVRFLTRYLDR
jgi:fermentation-respiration switch protein FrsA (DUF1100 family)